MDAEEKKRLEDLIRKEVEDLNETIKWVGKSVQPVAPDNAIGRLTRMEAINSKAINEATLRSSKAKLIKLEKTLLEIDQPEFGICIGCDKPIPAGRLMAVPESRMCVTCIGG